MSLSTVTDQFRSLKEANIEGRVCRLLADAPVTLYDAPGAGAQIMRRIKPGSLVVAYSDPGEMRQVNTPDQSFGYIPRSVVLLPVAGITPQGLYDPATRASVESGLPPMEEMRLAWEAKQKRARRDQYFFMGGFVLIILLGFFAVVKISPSKASGNAMAGSQAVESIRK